MHLKSQGGAEHQHVDESLHSHKPKYIGNKHMSVYAGYNTV